MSNEDDFMESADGSAKSHDELVWTALRPELERLRDDLICLVPGANVKTQVKAKFETKGKILKSILTEKIVEVVSLASVPRAPETSALPTRISISDLKANLADEWSGSLNALFQTIPSGPMTEAHWNELGTKRDLYLRKVEASLNAFEQQLKDRLRTPRTFKPLDFARQSLEADPPFDGDAIGQARLNSLQDDLAQAECQIGKLEGELKTLDGMIHTREQKISELQKQLKPLSYVANVLGCQEPEVQQGVNSLVSKVTALETDNDQLRKQVANATTFQDHSACKKQFEDLQAELQLEQTNASSAAMTIKDLRDTIESLRDQLIKHGIGQSLDALDVRLRQLGLFRGSNTDVSSSASTVIDNRCGSNGND